MNLEKLDEEVNYGTVIFRTNDISTLEKQMNPDPTEIVYEEVKLENQLQIKEIKRKFIFSTFTSAEVVLGTICLLLGASIIALSVFFSRQNFTWTEQNLQLRMENAVLTDQRNRLNRTIDVIMEDENFTVKDRCPKKVCKPCPDNWLLFQSNCYWFVDFKYSSKWKTWKESEEECGEQSARLLVIDGLQEQEFVNNQTEIYNSEKHGYWIGLRGNPEGAWTWVDGSALTQTFWSSEESKSGSLCVLSNPGKNGLASWDKTACQMKNRWICESRALMWTG